MPLPTTTVTAVAASNKERVETKLRGLQDSNRLAMHVWEQNAHSRSSLHRGDTVFSTRVAPERIPERLRSNTMPLISMSLVANTAADACVSPYSYHTHQYADPMFLFDLSQSHTNPARVIFTSSTVSQTGANPLKKAPALQDWDSKTGQPNVPELEALFKDRRNTPELCRIAGGDTGAEFTEKQLNLLSDYYLSGNAPKMHCYATPHLQTNELLVASSEEHVAAFALPFCEDDETPAGYKPLMNLLAAGYGIQLMRKGMDVPVVFYDMGTAQKGTFTYVAQGAQELYELAMNSLRELQAVKDSLKMDREDHRYEEHKRNIQTVRDSLKTTLGLDPFLPPEQQGHAIARLHREVECDFRPDRHWQL